jgi:hypothetical protein
MVLSLEPVPVEPDDERHNGQSHCEPQIGIHDNACLGDAIGFEGDP